MGKNELIEPLRVPAGALKRPHYVSGNYIAAKDLLTEQFYRLQLLRRHHRYLHGWGIVCGLQVVPVKDPARPWAVQVCPGVAIGPYGDEIKVRAPAVVDIREYLWRRLDDPGEPALVAYVGIRYAEEPVRPVPVNPPGCGCDDTIYEPSRIRDGLQVDVLWTPPEDGADVGFDLCEQRLFSCPECPESPYVILACVTLPAGEGDPITRDLIDNRTCRKLLYRTASLQEQLIECCCKDKPEPAPKADLGIRKEAEPRPGELGPVITYLLKITNQGPSAAEDIIIKDSLAVTGGVVVEANPDDFTASHGQWTEPELDGPPPPTTAEFEAKISVLAPLEVAELRFTVKLRLAEGSVVNTATVNSLITPDPGPHKNEETITTPFLG
jgi:uncharacterized repeat protein (TIGR01451 family)